MDIVTMDRITGTELKHLGLVQGNIVLTKHIGQDIIASLKYLVGGELQPFTELLK